MAWLVVCDVAFTEGWLSIRESQSLRATDCALRDSIDYLFAHTQRVPRAWRGAFRVKQFMRIFPRCTDHGDLFPVGVVTRRLAACMDARFDRMANLVIDSRVYTPRAISQRLVGASRIVQLCLYLFDDVGLSALVALRLRPWPALESLTLTIATSVPEVAEQPCMDAPRLRHVRVACNSTRPPALERFLELFFPVHITHLSLGNAQVPFGGRPLNLLRMSSLVALDAYNVPVSTRHLPPSVDCLYVAPMRLQQALHAYSSFRGRSMTVGVTHASAELCRWLTSTFPGLCVHRYALARGDRQHF